MNQKLSLGRYGIGVLLTLLCTLSLAQNPTAQSPKTSTEPFALQEDDRVVFLGNSLMENEQLYGYLELALTTRWPDRAISFRNLGWSGDNVFGAARSYFTNPPTSYELLMKQITDAQPTVVLVAYGGVEAQEGEAGLAHFDEGLRKLLDKISELGAKAVLLSPIPVLSTKNIPNLAQRNAMLQRYGTAIAKLAAERGQRFVDFYKPIEEIQKTLNVTDNDIHLNETGYYHLALALEKGLGLPARQENNSISVSQQDVASSTTAQIKKGDAHNDDLKFTMDARYLPLPLPREGGATVSSERMLQITGLKKGFYTLTADDEQITTASAKQWAEGVPLRQGPLIEQANQVREQIIKKNEIFFHQYRPQNRTYILGFRAYEQGRHAEGLKELGLIITWLEGQIALNRVPVSPIYQLRRLE